MEDHYHPHRFREAMSVAVGRIEEIERVNRTKNETIPAPLRAEFAGLSGSELLSRRGLLNHLELLIHDWQEDGGLIVDLAELELDAVNRR